MEEDKRFVDIKKRLTEYRDFPKKGIIFKDIFPIFKHPSLSGVVTDIFIEYLKSNEISAEVVLGLDSRGFLFAPQLAEATGASFYPIRKKGKLPGEVISASYSLEYGDDSLEVQKHAVQPGQKVVMVDDLLATGGTMAAGCEVVEKLGGKVVACLFVVELTSLGGSKKLPENADAFSIVKFEI